MTDKKTEALKLALEALEEIHPGNMTPMAEGNWNKAIAAIREALASEALEQPQCPHDFLMGDDEPGHDSVCMQCGAAVPNDEPAQQQEPVAWRELCRRLYVELYWCDRQMMETLDEDGEPVWTQGQTVRDVLADAKAALETSPPASKPLPLTDEQILSLVPGLQDCLCDPWDYNNSGDYYASIPKDMIRLARAIEAAHGIKENT